jgi:hypothetical protein
MCEKRGLFPFTLGAHSRVAGGLVSVSVLIDLEDRPSMRLAAVTKRLRC